ncbi:hypothetical protein OG884_32695 [Streptosporangium sp. NBC_01755]|uniref:hypothetical protein n=1 Tax=unclassified Streptosporangium TaxID=2632669 RepID=UPI002DDBC36A|nr:MULTISPECIES: hypothetical protein [unclassified Streptosporangium]WSA29023.1 hypothetical protein OIE13_14795 [Streptosporangium sp. NBC_01810]WSC99530.1 hypothetical protein OG884_32695 [Streptosporangium sp. NBC_01755]
MFHSKSIEERIAERQAERPALKEGQHFEHGPAKFVFIFVIVFVVVGHLAGLLLLMAMDLN